MCLRSRVSMKDNASPQKSGSVLANKGRHKKLQYLSGFQAGSALRVLSVSTQQAHDRT